MIHMSNQNSIIDPHIFRLIGKQVKGVTVDGDKRLFLNFSDNTVLVLGIHAEKLTAKLSHAVAQTGNASEVPTKRQLDYLVFISKYIQRYVRAPAEADIERHFLVSAPSVNNMMQTLERRGFITRQPRVPRSIKITLDLGPFGVV